MAYPAQSEHEGRAASPTEPILFRMLLQQHESILRNQLARFMLGRLLSVGVAVYVSLQSELSTTKVIAGAGVAMLVAVTWLTDSRRAAVQLAGLEETFGRRSGSETEDLYIASRHVLSSRATRSFGYALVLRYEPLVWLYLNIGLIIVSAVLGGVRT